MLTVLLAAGTVALTFAFRSPDATPKVFSPQEYREEEIAYRAGAVGKELTVRWEPDAAKVKRGRLLYGVSCATCHGANGDGNPVTPEGLSISPRDLPGGPIGCKKWCSSSTPQTDRTCLRWMRT